LAHLGDITGLRSQIQKLENQSEQNHAFTNHIAQLANIYDFRRIQSFLEPYMAKGSDSEENTISG
ncbi:MAG: hypothetical protein WAM60_10845, partial [Candidatus Promineifilaceae bacterium]